RWSQTNRGHARRLLTTSLAALARQGYERCFLEVTVTNANAIYLYRTLGFTEVGPPIVYGIRAQSE
ncbi:MAG: GNAT family N-acetyltransferase, partial [Chloroflexi bacterium]|nr:GNAT family N-acetyltransferase [Chloroflexota bacterium]